MVKVALVIALAACGPKPSTGTPSNAAAPGGELVLYRDRALVRHRLAITIPPGGAARARVTIAAGVAARDLVVVERDRFAIAEVQIPGDAVVPRDDEDPAPAEPKEIELVIGGRAGRQVVHVAYLTDRIHWDAAYTMITTPARDLALVRGALAIRNGMGIAMADAEVRVVDAELAVASRRGAELLATAFTGAEPATSPAAIPHDLGRVDVVDGETRIELLPDARPRPMRSVLVYDPVGTSLDRASSHPVRDEALGAVTPSARVTESFEITRDLAATRGLPGGPVRLLERHADGTLAVLGEARLFDAATRVAETDTVAVGTAEGVTGRRERRAYTYDEPRKRLVEDFVLSIDNTRPHPVEVVVREHLYRGQNWTLAYRSSPVAAKEGPQQIAMRMTVPARRQGQLLYVVVYTWP